MAARGAMRRVSDRWRRFRGDERSLRGILRRAKPARTTIIVAALPLKEARVEIDAIAYVGA